MMWVYPVVLGVCAWAVVTVMEKMMGVVMGGSVMVILWLGVMPYVDAEAMDGWLGGEGAGRREWTVLRNVLWMLFLRVMGVVMFVCGSVVSSMVGMMMKEQGIGGGRVWDVVVLGVVMFWYAYWMWVGYVMAGCRYTGVGVGEVVLSGRGVVGVVEAVIVGAVMALVMSVVKGWGGVGLGLMGGMGVLMVKAVRAVRDAALKERERKGLGERK